MVRNPSKLPNWMDARIYNIRKSLRSNLKGISDADRRRILEIVFEDLRKIRSTIPAAHLQLEVWKQEESEP